MYLEGTLGLLTTKNLLSTAMLYSTLGRGIFSPVDTNTLLEFVY